MGQETGIDRTFTLELPINTTCTLFKKPVEYPNDTVAVIMAMCDTFLNRGYVTWQRDYSVRRKECCIDGNPPSIGTTWQNGVYTPVPYYTHLYYLDDKKQPLKPSIIVWISKQL